MEIIMRRKDKEIKSAELLSQIIKKCQVCRLGLSQDNVPYIVPVSFGYDGKSLYFHSAKDGRKIDILSMNNKVCFEFESGVEIISDEDKPCSWSFSFQSVIGFGKAEELSSREDKVKGLEYIMGQYSDKKWDFSKIPIDKICVWIINIESMTGKQSLDHVDQ